MTEEVERKKAPLDSIAAGVIAILIADCAMAMFYIFVTAGIRRPAGDRPDFAIIRWAGLIQFLWVMPIAIYEWRYERRGFAKGAVLGGVIAAVLFFTRHHFGIA